MTKENLGQTDVASLGAKFENSTASIPLVADP